MDAPWYQPLGSSVCRSKSDLYDVDIDLNSNDALYSTQITSGDIFLSSSFKIQ